MRTNEPGLSSSLGWGVIFVYVFVWAEFALLFLPFIIDIFLEWSEFSCHVFKWLIQLQDIMGWSVDRLWRLSGQVRLLVVMSPIDMLYKYTHKQWYFYFLSFCTYLELELCFILLKLMLLLLRFITHCCFTIRTLKATVHAQIGLEAVPGFSRYCAKCYFIRSHFI